jgi:hypothetical protein
VLRGPKNTPCRPEPFISGRLLRAFKNGEIFQKAAIFTGNQKLMCNLAGFFAFYS